MVSGADSGHLQRPFSRLDTGRKLLMGDAHNILKGRTAGGKGKIGQIQRRMHLFYTVGRGWAGDPFIG